MQEGYDQALFNSIYKDTQRLRIKLARGINPDLYGLCYDDILSSFDVKFIFTFNKYYGTITSGQLKGRIIQALQFFKCRILRYSQTGKGEIHNTLDISDFYSIESHEFTEPQNLEGDHSFEDLLKLVKGRISSLSYTVLSIDYHPPLYIMTRLGDKKPQNKISNELIALYLGLEFNKETDNLLNLARREYRKLLNKIKV